VYVVLVHLLSGSSTSVTSVRVSESASEVTDRRDVFLLFHRKAVRATLILIPLLGLQYMLFPMRPQEGSILDDVYLITVAIVTSLQVR